MTRHALFFFFAGVCIPSVFARVVTDSVHTEDSWRYLQKFCFKPTPPDTVQKYVSYEDVEDLTLDAVRNNYGLFEYTLSYPKDSFITLSLYYDPLEGEDNADDNFSWKDVYRSSESFSNCSRRLEAASYNIATYRYGKQIPLKYVRIEPQG